MANMASDHSGPSSSHPHHQPFATPQPTPVQAASPPTKQNLKSWWAGFRKEGKKHDTQGKFHHHYRPSEAPSRDAFTRKESPFVALSPKKHRARFKEGDMYETIATPRGCSNHDLALRSPLLQADDTLRFSFEESLCNAPLTPQHQTMRPFSSFLPRSKDENQVHQEIRPKRFASMMAATEKTATVSPSPKFEKLRGARVKNGHSDSSDPLEAGVQKGPRFRPLSSLFAAFAAIKLMRTSAQSSKTENAKNSETAEPSPGIFGVPLRQSITYANVAISLVDADGKSYIYGYVPIVVAKCGVYLKEKATNVEGIFRLSGSEKRIKELKTVFDSPDRYGKGLDWAGYTVHDAANVLRRYLNQLPEPIVPLDLYDRFREPLRGHTMQAVGDTEGTQLPDSFNIEQAIKTYQVLITELPPLNRQLLLYILDLLAVFASKADENRMNSQNLAAIFQPGMLSHPSHDMAPSEYRLSQDVLIFLIENQDNFLIGMRGTAADEQTVQEVQAGGTPPPGTPSTPSRKNMVGRSASNASAGADSIRKFGGVRRNVSVSSRNSKQSNGAPSPASPALSHTTTGGVHRSNTVPSKRSPGIQSTRMQKNSGSPSPTRPIFAAGQTNPPRGLSPSARVQTQNYVSPSSPIFLPTTPVGKSSLAPSSYAPSVVTSQERLLGDQSGNQVEFVTPQKERNLSSLFNRSPTAESEKKLPNKLRKKQRQPSSNPSAQSSTNSLNGPQLPTSISASPALPPTSVPQDIIEHPVLESIPSATPILSNTDANPRSEQPPQQIARPDEPTHNSDHTLRAVSRPASVQSHSSFNDQSDADHIDDSAAASEQREKRSRWRFSRHRDTSQNYGTTLSPRKGLGSDAGAGTSTSSVGSAARLPRKSFTAETLPTGSDSALIGAHPQTSNDSGSVATAANDEKKRPFGWMKKIRGKREESREKDDGKERNKSPPASNDRVVSMIPGRGKSVDLQRETITQKTAEEPRIPLTQE